MVAKFYSLRFSLPLCCALLLGGCVFLQDPKANEQINEQAKEQDERLAAVEKARALREQELQLTWIGLPYEELLEVFGKPHLIMNIPAYRPWRASVVVYEKFDIRSGCIDAFAIEHSNKPIIYDYFCR